MKRIIIPLLLGAASLSAAVLAVSGGPHASPTAALDPPGRRRIEVELITIKPSGFTPTHITRPAGRFLLAVDNKSGVEPIDLRLAREADGGRLRDVRLPGGKLRWREGLELRPGRYVLTEAGHPDWVCRVDITE